MVAGGTGLGYYLYKQKKAKSSSTDPNLIDFFGLESGKQGLANPLAPSKLQGITWARTLVSGQLYGGQYELFPDVNRPLASHIEKATGLKIVFEDGEKQKKDYMIGEGQFGRLRIARNAQTKEFIGVKVVTGEKKIEDSINEAQIQVKLKGLPHIMPLLDYHLYVPDDNNMYETITEPTLFQFMPLAGFGNGTFFQTKLALLNHQDLKNKLLIHVAKGLLTGLAHMHQAGIYHLDMKPANLVMDRKGEVFVIDFGCAQELGQEEATGSAGDIRYFSPERLADRRFHHGHHYPNMEGVESFSAAAADAWAAGVTLLEMALNQYPFELAPVATRLAQWDYAHMNTMLERIKDLENPPSSSVMRVIKGLLAVNSRARLKIADALKWDGFGNSIAAEEQAKIFNELGALRANEVPFFHSNGEDEVYNN
jgi:serine/threonine protein kinase